MKTTSLSLITPAALLGFLTTILQAATIVAPSNLTTLEGNDANAFPFGTNEPIRYQQVYAASEFSALAPQGEFITHIALRVDAGGPAFATTLPDIQINLSTTLMPPDGLSSTFANNVGPNDQVVYARGSLSLSSTTNGPPAGPNPFDVVISLTTPFFYRPSQGNLLLDVRNFAGGTAVFFLDTHQAADSVSRAHLGGDANAATANSLNSQGLVTRFATIVPEPSTGALLVSAFAISSARRGRK